MIKQGDKIRTQGPWGTQHYGIYLGYVSGCACVIHNDKGTGVDLTTFEAFSNGNDVFIAQSAPNDRVAQDAIARRALALRGQQYDLLFFNCEDFANYAQTGTAYSTQVFGWGLAALVALLAIRPLFAR